MILGSKFEYFVAMKKKKKDTVEFICLCRLKDLKVCKVVPSYSSCAWIKALMSGCEHTMWSSSDVDCAHIFILLESY